MFNPELEILSKNSEDACYGDLEGFKVVLEEVIETWRWGNLNRVIVQSETTNKYYESSYRDTSGDYGGDFTDCNDEDLTWVEVEPKERVTIVDETVKIGAEVGS